MNSTLSNPSYTRFHSTSVEISPLCKYFFGQLLKGVKRKISKRATIRSPWMISAITNIPPPLFIPWYKAVKDSRSQRWLDIEVVRYRDGTLQQVKIKFTHIGVCRYHLGQAVGCIDHKELNDLYFKKVWSDDVTGQVVVNEQNPATVTYLAKSGKLTFSTKYVVKNKFGHVCY